MLLESDGGDLPAGALRDIRAYGAYVINPLGTGWGRAGSRWAQKPTCGTVLWLFGVHCGDTLELSGHLDFGFLVSRTPRVFPRGKPWEGSGSRFSPGFYPRGNPKRKSPGFPPGGISPLVFPWVFPRSFTSCPGFPPGFSPGFPPGFGDSTRGKTRGEMPHAKLSTTATPGENRVFPRVKKRPRGKTRGDSISPGFPPGYSPAANPGDMRTPGGKPGDTGLPGFPPGFPPG